MFLARLLTPFGRWWANHPKPRLRRAYALLPDGAFTLDGIHWTRADVEEWLDVNEIQILLEVLAEIGDEYEEQRQTSLPNDFWQHLHMAAERLECLEELKLYMRDGQRVRGLYRKAEDTPE